MHGHDPLLLAVTLILIGAAATLLVHHHPQLINPFTFGLTTIVATIAIIAFVTGNEAGTSIPQPPPVTAPAVPPAPTPTPTATDSTPR
ncbi:hypothetical protein ACFQ9J_15960 [Streptomyces sp. NPDC056529]|uniref:hypothetical protein n=1 Tax=Streptomyces sp. NPDC056529 TaxID=3345855 RepID=UPI0036B4DCBD